MGKISGSLPNQKKKAVETSPQQLEKHRETVSEAA